MPPNRLSSRVRASRLCASSLGSACQHHLAGKCGLSAPIRVGSHSAQAYRGANASSLHPLATRPSCPDRLCRGDCMIALRRSFSAARIARARFAKLKGIEYVWREQLSEATPAWARSLRSRAACRFDMRLLDDRTPRADIAGLDRRDADPRPCRRPARRCCMRGDHAPSRLFLLA
jgi:hypothetical protein